MVAKKILVVSHEMSPYTDLTSLSEKVKDIAVNLQKDNAEVRVFMPKYGLIKERKHRLHEVIRLSGLNITIGRENNPLIIKVATLQGAKIQVYFLDNLDFFHRKAYFTDSNNKAFEDNGQRMIFFNKGVVELLFKLGWIPDIIHCHGWFSSLLPFYAKATYKNEPAFKNATVVFGYHYDEFTQAFPENFALNAEIDKKTLSELNFINNADTQNINLLALHFADSVYLSSDNIPENINTYLNTLNKPVIQGNKLEGDEILQEYKEKVSIL